MGITANLAETTKIKPYIRHAAANYLLIQPNNFTVVIYLQNIPSFPGYERVNALEFPPKFPPLETDNILYGRCVPIFSTSINSLESSFKTLTFLLQHSWTHITDY